MDDGCSDFRFTARNQVLVMLLLYGFEPGITSVDDAVQVILPSSRSINACPISCSRSRSMGANWMPSMPSKSRVPASNGVQRSL